MLEKPIGHSLDSALEINEAIGAVFPEARIYRIDHYLGETVQNLMALRFANALFEPIWRAGHIDHVQITVAETLGVENRGGYYDNAGAMRDMLQNHLLQLLCLVAMEAPVRFDAKHIRGEKVKVLEALKPITGNDVLDKTVRGQYGAGRIGGHDVPAYYFEPNIDNDSDTETFVAVKAEIDNWRWAGVPFYLRTGSAWRASARRSSSPSRCRTCCFAGRGQPPGHQPATGGKHQPATDGQGTWQGMQLEPVELDLNLACFSAAPRRWEAYERLLLDVIEGDSTLFMRRDEVEAAWNWVDPILRGWSSYYRKPRPYPAGEDGQNRHTSSSNSKAQLVAMSLFVTRKLPDEMPAIALAN